MVALLSRRQKSLQQGQNLMQVCVGCCEITFSSAGWLSLLPGHTNCTSMSSLDGNSFVWPSAFMTQNVCQPGCVASFAKYEITVFFFFFLLLLFCFILGGLVLLLGGRVFCFCFPEYLEQTLQQILGNNRLKFLQNAYCQQVPTTLRINDSFTPTVLNPLQLSDFHAAVNESHWQS